MTPDQKIQIIIAAIIVGLIIALVVRTIWRKRNQEVDEIESHDEDQ